MNIPSIITSLEDFNYQNLNDAIKRIYTVEKQIFAMQLKETLDNNNDVDYIMIIVPDNLNNPSSFNYDSSPFETKKIDILAYDEYDSVIEDVSQYLNHLTTTSLTAFYTTEGLKNKHIKVNRNSLEENIKLLFGEKDYTLYQQKIISDYIKKPTSSRKPKKI